MPKTVDDIIMEIAKATAEMEDADAADFLEDIKDQIETMLESIEEETQMAEEEEEEEKTGD